MPQLGGSETAPRSENTATSRPDAAGPRPRGDPPAQIAGAVAVLARNGAGSHRLILQLDPAELGRVQVVIDRRDGVPATVTLTVARPETLLRLVRDQDQLSRALDQAGLAPEGRSVRFQLAAPDPAPDAPRGEPRAQEPGGLAVPQRQDAGGDGRADGGARQEGRPGPGREHGRARQDGLDRAFMDTVAINLPAARVLRLRGIDITA